MATPPGTRTEARPRPATWLLAGTDEGLTRAPGFPSRDRNTGPEVLHEGSPVTCLARGPGGELLAGTPAGNRLLKSVDDGDTWRRVDALLDATVRVLAVIGERAPAVWAGLEPAGLQRSLDLGSTWEPVESFGSVVGERAGPSTDSPPRVTSILSDPDNPDGLFVALESGGVHYTPDDGRTWQPRTEGLPNEVHALCAHPEEPEAIWAATSYGIHRSEDAGESWRSRNQGIPNKYATAIAVHPDRDPDTAYATTAQGPNGSGTRLYVTTDAGHSWSTFDNLPDTLGPVLPNGLAIDPDDAESLYIGTRDGEIWTTRNRGGDWDLLLEGLPPVRSLLVLSREPAGEMY